MSREDETINPDELSPTGDDWQRQFTAAEPRLSEMIALYESLGLEVRLGPATPEPGQQCSVCLADSSVRTIYTRRRKRRARPRKPLTA